MFHKSLVHIHLSVISKSANSTHFSFLTDQEGRMILYFIK